MNWNIQKWVKGDEGITSTVCLPSSNAFRGPRIGAFSKLHIRLYCFSCSGIVVPYLILRSVVLDGWCTAFYYFFSSASGTLHLSNKDSLRKVKVQKDSMPIGNKPSPSLYTGLLTPHSWVRFMAAGKLIIVGWLGNQPSIYTYSCHHFPLCFPCDSFISSAIATGLACAHGELKFLSTLSSKHLSPFSGPEEVFFLNICLLTQSWPTREGTSTRTSQDLGDFFQKNLVCWVGESYFVSQSLDCSSRSIRMRENTFWSWKSSVAHGPGCIEVAMEKWEKWEECSKVFIKLNYFIKGAILYFKCSTSLMLKNPSFIA